MTRIIFISFGLATLSFQLIAQTKSVGLSPVPIWPKNEDVSSFPGHYVFLDLRSAAYVVSYVSPETNQKVTVRFGAHSLVDPSVTVHITAASKNALHYEYQVANGPHAPQSIQKVTLLVPAEDSGARAQHPSWTAARSSSVVHTMVAPGSGFTPVEWSAKAGQAIAPGSTIAALSVDSEYLPGFIDILTKGASQFAEYDATSVAALPKEAADQLQAVLSQGWDAKRELTIGPVFQGTASPQLIAANLYHGTRALVRNRQLDPHSPFVEAELSALFSFLNSGETASFGPAQLGFTSKASDGLESEIATALRLDFGR
jgi:hypothetical protein